VTTTVELLILVYVAKCHSPHEQQGYHCQPYYQALSFSLFFGNKYTLEWRLYIS